MTMHAYLIELTAGPQVEYGCSPFMRCDLKQKRRAVPSVEGLNRPSGLQYCMWSLSDSGLLEHLPQVDAGSLHSCGGRQGATPARTLEPAPTELPPELLVNRLLRLGKERSCGTLHVGQRSFHCPTSYKRNGLDAQEALSDHRTN